MTRLVFAAICGFVFGIGLALSQVVDPAKILGFLDFVGNWDPSLAFVFGGAVIAAFIGYRIVLRRPAPMFDGAFRLPSESRIDGRLVGGAVLFGIGWGLIGLCPGPAVAALAFARIEPVYFVIAMLVGMFIVRSLPSGGAKTVAAGEA